MKTILLVLGGIMLAVQAMAGAPLPGEERVGETGRDIRMYLQAGAFHDLSHAEDRQRLCRRRLPFPFQDRVGIVREKDLHKVLIGPLTSLDRAKALQEDLYQVVPDAFLIRISASTSNPGEPEDASLVSANSRIDDTEAALLLAKALQHRGRPGDLDRAETLLWGLWSGKARPRFELGHRLAEILLDLERRSQALQLAETLDSLAADSKEFFQLAEFLARVGHYQDCRRLASRGVAASASNNRLKAHLQQAGLMVLWGDFYGAESRYRSWLAEHPGDTGIRLELAEVLASSQRYDQAEGVLMEVLAVKTGSPSQRYRAHLLLIRQALWQKDFSEALKRWEDLPSEIPAEQRPGFGGEDPAGMGRSLMLKARALEGLDRFEEAAAVYRRVAESSPSQVQALLGLGRMLSQAGQQQEAEAVWRRVLERTPEQPRARFELLWTQQHPPRDWVKRLRHPLSGPEEFRDLAEVLSSEGYFGPAAECLAAALEIDSNYVPARLELAQTLASDRQYRRAIDELRILREAFPESSKIRISQARVLGWSRRYEKALEVYAGLQQDNPDDPVVWREAGRTAFWGKMPERSEGLYRQVWTPSLDSRLLRRLRPLGQALVESSLSPAWSYLQSRVAEDRTKGTLPAGQAGPVPGYERMQQAYELQSASLSPRLAREVSAALHGLSPDFRLQRKAWLEYRSKRLLWDKRFIPAMRVLQQVISVEPGNEEASFDLAQTQCALGLCDDEAETYRKLLELDPQHSLAGKALQEHEEQSNPAILARFHVFDEEGGEENEGRGEAALISRQRWDLGLEVPIDCRHKLRIIGHRYREDPKRQGEVMTAHGLSLEGTFLANEFVSFEGGLGWKRFQKELARDTETGFARLNLNLWSAARLTAFWERRNEVSNVFALEDGVQSDRLGLDLRMPISRFFEVELGGAYRFYHDPLPARAADLGLSDDNTGWELDAGLRYTLSDHPRELSLVLSGEYRDTEEDGFPVDQMGRPLSPGARVDDFVHPYWTPQDYLGGNMSLEWRHDLSDFFFCRAADHVYELAVSLGTDDTGNESFEFSAEWEYELFRGWAFALSGMLHRSEEWDAHSLLLELRYRLLGTTKESGS